MKARLVEVRLQLGNYAASAALSCWFAVIQGEHVRSRQLDLQVYRVSAIVPLSQWALFWKDVRVIETHLQFHSNSRKAKHGVVKFG